MDDVPCVIHGVLSSMVAAVTSLSLLGMPASAATTSATCPRAPRPGAETVGPVTARPAQDVASRACAAEPTTARQWQSLFDGLSGQWAGGDGASSTRLPDGRVLWLFGDTYVGGTMTTGARAPGTRLVRNSLVVTRGSCAAPVATTGDALPGRSGSWLWPTHAVVTWAGSAGVPTRLVVFAQRVVRTSADAFGFRRTGTATISLTVPWNGIPVVGAVRDLPTTDILWGASVVTDGTTTWVYGTRSDAEPLVFGRALFLARAPTVTVGDTMTWRYRTASGWSTHPGGAVAVRPARDGVSTVPSATRVASGYVIVTKAEEFLDDHVVALWAPNAWGPWTTTNLFEAPSTTDVLRYSPAVVAGSPGSRAVVVVSRTATTLVGIAHDADDTRPSFTDVRLPR